MEVFGDVDGVGYRLPSHFYANRTNVVSRSFVLTSVCTPHLEMAMAGSGACQDITVHARTANPTAAEHQWIFILS